jgi:hypothetical protein
MSMWKQVSKQATWGISGRNDCSARIAAREGGLWSGARSVNAVRASSMPLFRRTGRVNAEPPWTTR